MGIIMIFLNIITFCSNIVAAIISLGFVIIVYQVMQVVDLADIIAASIHYIQLGSM